MPPSEQSVTAGLQGNGSSTKPPINASRQRFKPQLSCTFCRQRKLKCDRNLPCQNCVKRNQAPTCTYVHANLRDRTSQVQKSTVTSSKDVKTQIQHLEDLVLSLMNQGNGEATVTAESRQQATPESSLGHDSRLLDAPSQQGYGFNLTGTAESLGRISIEDKQTNYVGGGHWTAILDSIACLKDQLVDAEPPRTDPELQPGPELLVGSVKAVNRAEILASVPSRDEVDRLVQAYFDTPDLGSSMLHRPTFMREFENFWRDPQSVPVIWIGLLYSILCLTTYFEIASNQYILTRKAVALRDPMDMIDIFREKTVQCLVLSNYTKPMIYTVETLFLYYISEHFRFPDTQFGAWMVLGLAVRAGLRLGLHRDASHYSNISVFRGEMQRRIWSVILHMDLQASLQVGLPRMIKTGTYDTQPPRNILDVDFDEYTQVLPPERSEIESTAIGYSNSKHRISKVLGMIVDQASSVDPMSYEDTMKLDRRLHDDYESVPEALKVRDISDFYSGTSVARLRKFSIDMTFQKARCILHRKFFVTSTSGNSYPFPYSMKACVEAAMRILQAQVVLHEEMLPGAALHGDKWRSSSLMTHDFLLAAMLICLYLGHRVSENNSGLSYPSTQIRVKWSQEEMRQTIEGSRKIWEESSSTSKEANKAALALKAMLSKLKSNDESEKNAQDIREKATPATTTNQTYLSTNSPSTSWMPTYAMDDAALNNATNAFENSATMEIDSLNWELWDNQFHDNNLVNGPPEGWAIDGNFMFPDPSFMQWDQQS